MRISLSSQQRRRALDVFRRQAGNGGHDEKARRYFLSVSVCQMSWDVKKKKGGKKKEKELSTFQQVRAKGSESRFLFLVWPFPLPNAYASPCSPPLALLDECMYVYLR